LHTVKPADQPPIRRLVGTVLSQVKNLTIVRIWFEDPLLVKMVVEHKRNNLTYLDVQDNMFDSETVHQMFHQFERLNFIHPIPWSHIAQELETPCVTRFLGIDTWFSDRPDVESQKRVVKLLASNTCSIDSIHLGGWWWDYVTDEIQEHFPGWIRRMKYIRCDHKSLRIRDMDSVIETLRKNGGNPVLEVLELETDLQHRQVIDLINLCPSLTVIQTDCDIELERTLALRGAWNV